MDDGDDPDLLSIYLLPAYLDPDNEERGKQIQFKQFINLSN